MYASACSLRRLRLLASSDGCVCWLCGLACMELHPYFRCHHSRFCMHASACISAIVIVSACTLQCADRQLSWLSINAPSWRVLRPRAPSIALAMSLITHAFMRVAVRQRDLAREQKAMSRADFLSQQTRLTEAATAANLARAARSWFLICSAFFCPPACALSLALALCVNRFYFPGTTSSIRGVRRPV